MNNLGFLNKDLENCETAEQFYLKSLKIRQNLFSENHSDIAQSLNNLGLLYNDYGNLEKAEEFYYLPNLMFKGALGFVTDYCSCFFHCCRRRNILLFAPPDIYTSPWFVPYYSCCFFNS